MPENATIYTKNYLNQTYGELIDRFQKQLKYFREVVGVQRIVICWECTFLSKVSKRMLDMEKLESNTMIFRNSLRGGRCSVF